MGASLLRRNTALAEPEHQPLPPVIGFAGVLYGDEKRFRVGRKARAAHFGPARDLEEAAGPSAAGALGFDVRVSESAPKEQ